MLNLCESDLYYFDADAAEKPIKFIQKYLCHYEDRYAGLPFLLLDWQKQIVRDIFGWKRRSDRLRRFREIYIEIGKGNGKSPFITAIAIYLFLFDRQEGQQIYSIASDFKQANITFDAAKKMILASPKLAEKVKVNQYEILYPTRNNKWAIMSGTGEGKAGFRPTCVLADEAHEWENRKMYDNVSANMLKRSEPLFLIATNAGSNRSTICFELHQRAMRVLEGVSSDDTLYPVIFAAGKDDDWSDESTWAKANPSLGSTITADGLRLEYLKAKENPALEARFRRLYLSQWIQGADKLIDLSLWDACAKPMPANLGDLPCYLGIDLSVNDDLSSVAAIWLGKERWYSKIWTYVPRRSAQKYQDQDSIPFDEWEQENYVRILESQTVDDSALLRIEKFILKLNTKYKIQTVGYDKYRANALIARLEKKGMTCIAVRPDYEGMSAGTHELLRRLKDQSIVLPINPAVRWQASNCEGEFDKLGNVRLIKEAAGGTYSGRRGAKIDAIMSLVIALSEAKKHEFRDASNHDAALAAWSGEIAVI